MFRLLKYFNQNKPMLREMDPTTTQRIIEGAYLVKAISETEVSARKCEFFAGNAEDKEVADFFTNEAKLLRKVKLLFQDYYESITKE